MQFEETNFVLGKEIDELIFKCCPNITNWYDTPDYFSTEYRSAYEIRDNGLVGFMQWKVIFDGEGEFEYLFVLPEYRHKVDWWEVLKMIPTGVMFDAAITLQQLNLLKALGRRVMIHELSPRNDKIFCHRVVFEIC